MCTLSGLQGHSYATLAREFVKWKRTLRYQWLPGACSGHTLHKYLKMLLSMNEDDFDRL